MVVRRVLICAVFMQKNNTFQTYKNLLIVFEEKSKKFACHTGVFLVALLMSFSKFCVFFVRYFEVFRVFFVNKKQKKNTFLTIIVPGAWPDPTKTIPKIQLKKRTYQSYNHIFFENKALGINSTQRSGVFCGENPLNICNTIK